MNDRQRWCLGIGGLVVVLMLLFPPRRGSIGIDYDWVGNVNPLYPAMAFDILVLQVLAAVVLAVVGFVLLKR